MERSKNKIEISEIDWANLDLNKLNWDKIDVNEFLQSEKGMKATYDAINEGYNKYCKTNGLNPDKPEEWPSATKK
tara:strand:- start:253 stop:477 length:225 start_codon:yes stop_codon:yes gene_type:complete